MLIRQWDIYLAKIPIEGVEMGEVKSVLVISNNAINKFSQCVNVIIVAPKKYANENNLLHVDIEVNEKDTIALVNHNETINKNRLVVKVGQVNDERIRKKILAAWNMIINNENKMEQLEFERFFEIGSTFEKDEDNEYEFKEFRVDQEAPRDLMARKLEKYICGFLNGENNKFGKIYFGITDDGIIKGTYLNREDRDDIRQLFIDRLKYIRPVVDRSLFTIEFIKLKKNGKIEKDYYIIEIYVPPSPDPSVLYFTRDDKLYIRFDGRNEKIEGPEIQEVIKTRLLNKIIGDKDFFKSPKS
ncbi:RNA-binding domain-containing protein [Anaeromicrobium sediminis]|uniref:Schlafen AlbA-2 domain-containing protein n=1 Tax=Anaeromicrobium sediminis TaxID=1478221 RepID=A0A267MBG8_9FIRM|nr:RNA-binding domain-containing protein [Anaeromicrobium sediminis]PAB56899.1 hypothetical protein CCE28_20000 [Anaeromicrobium sediminis]